jgi:hypothetical protein
VVRVVREFGMSDGAVSRLCGTAHRATVRQKKTGHPVRFELTEQTWEAIDDHIKAAGKKPDEFRLWCCSASPGPGMQPTPPRRA